jgi:hypothetical protein
MTFVRCLSKHKARGPPTLSSPRLLIQYIHSYLPYLDGLFHPQTQDAPLSGEKGHAYLSWRNKGLKYHNGIISENSADFRGPTRRPHSGQADGCCMHVRASFLATSVAHSIHTEISFMCEVSLLLHLLGRQIDEQNTVFIHERLRNGKFHIPHAQRKRRPKKCTEFYRMSIQTTSL